jgi:hypothetical protein
MVDICRERVAAGLGAPHFMPTAQPDPVMTPIRAAGPIHASYPGPILEREQIDPLGLSTSGNEGPNYWKTPAHTLTEPARSGWLEKEGHVVKNWRRRWFVLWPASGSEWAKTHSASAWAKEHGDSRTRQLLLYYESAESQVPKGIVPLRPGSFSVTSAAGGDYRGEETVVLTVDSEATASHSRYIIRSEEPGNPGDLARTSLTITPGPGSLCTMLSQLSHLCACCSMLSYSTARLTGGGIVARHRVGRIDVPGH